MDYDGDHEQEPWPEMNGQYGAQIRNTWVHEHFRGHGIARAMKQEAEAIARADNASFLYTRCARLNTKIISLNRQLGYEITEEAGDFLRMRLKLVPDLW